MCARIVAFTGSLLLLTMQASAGEIVIDLPADSEVDYHRAAYDCEGSAVDVEYINAGPISLAVIELGDETIVASNVISASGAKYAGARYIWWSKGDEAFLYDLMRGKDAPPVNCASAS